MELKSLYGPFINEICFGSFKNGKRFAAKLIEIRGDDILIFENSRGYRFINRASELAELTVLEPRPEA